MATAKAERSVRLVGKKTLELDRTSGNSGEIFYDTDTQTLRIYASSSSSVVVATRTWVTANTFNGNYNNLTNKPSIPSLTGYATETYVTTRGYITTNGIPAQSSQSGKYLTTDGSALSWGTVTATWPVTNTNGASGPTLIAIGQYAGFQTQSAGAIAIGAGAGTYTQGTNGIAIGLNAQTSYPGVNNIGIGENAGNTSQGSYAIAIGQNAGQNTQGSYAIAIGTSAAPTSQGTNSIVLNASGTNLNTTNSGFYVKPVRTATSTSVIYYNTTSGEMTYGAVPSGSASGIAWTSNTTSSGSITVTNPTGYNTSGSTMVIVVVGTGATMTSASSGSGSFSTASSVGSNTRVFYTYTTSSLASTTTISGGAGYYMAYAYIGTGPSISTSSNTSSSTSTSMTNPSPQYGTPRIIGVSTTSSLNLATYAGAATGGGVTWATGSGFVHPNDSNLSAAIWVGTGSWTSMATPTLTSNPSFFSWSITGITVN